MTKDQKKGKEESIENMLELLLDIDPKNRLYRHLYIRYREGGLNGGEMEYLQEEYRKAREVLRKMVEIEEEKIKTSEKTEGKNLKDSLTSNTKSMLSALLEEYPKDIKYEMLCAKADREGLTTEEIYDITKEYTNKIMTPRLYNKAISTLDEVLDQKPDEIAALKAKACILRDFFGNKTKAGDLEDNVKKLEKKDGDGLLRVITPRYDLDDVVLSQQNKEQIQQAVAELKHKKLIYEKWGFGTTLNKNSKGTTMLFIGEPGVGKTMAAEAFAEHLGKKLLVANYAQLQSKSWGETEKNIEACFKEAKEKEAVLFLDEAESMLISRDSRDVSWWYPQQVNVLLKEIENFDGVLILATNMSSRFDPALGRRMSIVIKFDFPDAEMREQIYRKMIPEKAPVAEDVDFGKLARDYPLAGGDILNVVKSSVRSAALRHDEGLKDEIKMKDFEDAARQGCGKSKVLEQNYLRKEKEKSKDDTVNYIR